MRAGSTRAALVLAFATIVAGIALGDGAAKPARAPMVTGALYGRAMRDSVAVANTNVVVLGTRCTTVTDANGWFRINAVPVGRWVLRAVGERCAGDIANVTVDAGSVDTVVVSLDCPEIDCDFPGKRGLPAGCLLRDAQARRRAGTFCHAHPRERLAVDTVQVSYGLLLHQPGFDQAERDSFPDAHTFADGGCVTGQTAYQEVVYCAACRRARDNWQRAHPRPHH